MGFQMTPVAEESGDRVETKLHQRERMAFLCQLFDVNSHKPEMYSQKRAEYIPECGIYKIGLYFQEVNAILEG